MKPNAAPSPAQRIEPFRAIVRTCTRATIDGVRVDLFSAGAVVRVFDALNEANRAKFTSLEVPAMVILAYKLLK